MTLNDLAERIQTALRGKSFDGSLKFDCGEDRVIVLADNSATTLDQKTDCTIALSRENLGKLLSGKLNPMTGVMMGKLKVSGDMGVALNLGKLL